MGWVGAAGDPWTGRDRHLVERKWRAGRSAAQIARELGRGLRQVKEVCARLRKDAAGKADPVGGGAGQATRKRRLFAVKAYVGADSAKSPGRGRKKRPTLVVVNKSTRKERKEWSTTSYRTTARDVSVAGSRRVLRSRGILCERDRLNGRVRKSQREVREIVGAARRQLQDVETRGRCGKKRTMELKTRIIKR